MTSVAIPSPALPPHINVQKSIPPQHVGGATHGSMTQEKNIGAQRAERMNPFILLLIILAHGLLVLSLFWITTDTIQPPAPLAVSVRFVTQEITENAVAPQPQETIRKNPTERRASPATPSQKTSPKPLPFLQTLAPTSTGVVLPNTDAAPTTDSQAISQASTPQPAKPASQGIVSTAKLEAARADLAYLNNPKPTYPPLSVKLGEQGSVTLRVYVDAQGKPVRVTVATSSGSERLDRAAVKAVQEWKFQPAKRGDQAVEDTALVPITFTLDH